MLSMMTSSCIPLVTLLWSEPSPIHGSLLVTPYSTWAKSCSLVLWLQRALSIRTNEIPKRALSNIWEPHARVDKHHAPQSSSWYFLHSSYKIFEDRGQKEWADPQLPFYSAEGQHQSLCLFAVLRHPLCGSEITFHFPRPSRDPGI